MKKLKEKTTLLVVHSSTGLERCPFCGMELTGFHPKTNWSTGWAQHPKNPLCIFDRWEFDCFDPTVWNTRSNV